METLRREATPTVGMGATRCYYSDRHAYTIVKVSPSNKTFWMQRDEAKRADKRGMCDQQDYNYTPDTNAPMVRVYKAQSGKWRVRGGGETVILDWRGESYDYSF